jgi:Asp-tRNA(Asn)/Glu-tRNA(Gln) amidotransferase A subunit family amidase
MISEDVLFAGIREIGAQLRARRFSAVELAELSLRRLETLGPSLGALVQVTRERAMREAPRANQELFAGKDRGPLHGIPYGVKDLVATKGIATSWGALPLREQVLDYDATVVTRLEQAGAVMVAKLAMVELAGGMGYNSPDASFTGPGRTPWNTGYWSGGSSSGSAAAVAAGLVPFAIGSETSGSILTPAAFCGVTGLRPSYGLVSRHGAMALAWTLDKLGPIARSAEDCAIVLAAIAGPDPKDPTTTGDLFRHKAPAERPARRFRVGVLRHATLDTDADVESSFKQAVGALREVADVDEDVPLPDLPYAEAVRLIVAAEGARLRELSRADASSSSRIPPIACAASRACSRRLSTTSTRCGRASRCAPSSTRCCRATTRSSHPPARGSLRRSVRTSTRPRPARRRRQNRSLARCGHRPRSLPATWPACRRSRCRWASAATACRSRCSSSGGPSPRRRSWRSGRPISR